MRIVDFKVYQDRAYTTAGDHDNLRLEVINWSLGIAGESGEIIDLIKKFAFHGHDLSLHALDKELGDLLWYISTLCTAVGLNLEEVADHNLEKLARRYPQGFNHSDSIHRVE